MKTIQIGKKPEIEEIEWKQYEGETIIVATIIRKGQRITETAFYPDKVKAVPNGNAYVIGNGPSRKGFDLNKLKETGQTYGCNALYRDFIPDFIFSVDAPITQEMYKNEVYKKCIHYAPSLEVNRYPKNTFSLFFKTKSHPHCDLSLVWSSIRFPSTLPTTRHFLF